MLLYRTLHSTLLHDDFLPLVLQAASQDQSTTAFKPLRLQEVCWFGDGEMVGFFSQLLIQSFSGAVLLFSFTILESSSSGMPMDGLLRAKQCN